MTLADAFKDWLDFDGAEFALAKCLGLMPDVLWDPVAHKHLFWTANRFGNELYSILERLVAMGALAMNDERQFRWNASFDHKKTADIEEEDV